MSLILTTFGGMTNATITATATTSVIAAPGTSNSLLVRLVHVFSNTTTAAINVSWNNSGGPNVLPREFTAAGTTSTFDFGPGWLLSTNTALNLVVAATASTPSYNVTVVFDILNRTR